MPAPAIRFAALLVLVLGLGVTRAGTREQARRIVVPEFKVEEATPATVFQRIRTLAKELDPENQGVNLVFQMTPAGKAAMQEPGINMELRNVSVEKLVEYACLAAGLHCRFDEQAVIVADQLLPADAMRTRVFNVAPGVVDPERTRPKAKKIEWRD